MVEDERAAALLDVIGQSFAIAQEMMSSVWRNAAT